MAIQDFRDQLRPQVDGPLDTRDVAANEAARFAYPAGASYEGMEVYQDDTGEVYRLTDIDNIGNTGGWTLISNNAGEANVQSDWDETDTESDAYIQNKPTIPAAQIQSNWSETDTESLSYIQNKPVLAPSDAEENQNAFTRIFSTGETALEADQKNDALHIEGGDNVTITLDDDSGDTVTIASTDTQLTDSEVIDAIANSTSIASGTQATVRSNIGAGTSSLELGTTSTTALRGDYTPTKAQVDAALDTSGANDAAYYRGDGSWHIPDLANAVEVLFNGTTLSEDVSKLNFAGTGVTLTEPSADEVTITINAGGGGISDLSSFTTNDLAEGTSNLYFTNSRAVSALTTTLSDYQLMIDSGNRLNANLIGDGSVSNTEFEHLNGVSSDIQTQLDGKEPEIGLGGLNLDRLDDDDATNGQVLTYNGTKWEPQDAGSVTLTKASVDNAIGASSSGDATLFYNQQGAWVAPSGGGNSNITVTSTSVTDGTNTFNKYTNANAVSALESAATVDVVGEWSFTHVDDDSPVRIISDTSETNFGNIKLQFDLHPDLGDDTDIGYLSSADLFLRSSWTSSNPHQLPRVRGTVTQWNNPSDQSWEDQLIFDVLSNDGGTDKNGGKISMQGRLSENNGGQNLQTRWVFTTRDGDGGENDNIETKMVVGPDTVTMEKGLTVVVDDRFIVENATSSDNPLIDFVSTNNTVVGGIRGFRTSVANDRGSFVLHRDNSTNNTWWAVDAFNNNSNVEYITFGGSSNGDGITSNVTHSFDGNVDINANVLLGGTTTFSGNMTLGDNLTVDGTTFVGYVSQNGGTNAADFDVTTEWTDSEYSYDASDLVVDNIYTHNVVRDDDSSLVEDRSMANENQLMIHNTNEAHVEWAHEVYGRDRDEFGHILNKTQLFQDDTTFEVRHNTNNNSTFVSGDALLSVTNDQTDIHGHLTIHRNEAVLDMYDDGTAGTGDKGLIRFSALNDSDEQHTIAEIVAHSLNVGDGTEDGEFQFKTRVDGGSLVTSLSIQEPRTTIHNLLRLHGRSSDPADASSENGDLYYHNSDHQVRAYLNGTWTDISGGGDSTGLPNAPADPNEDRNYQLHWDDSEGEFSWIQAVAGSIDVSDNYEWTGNHTFESDVTLGNGTGDTITIGGTLGVDAPAVFGTTSNGRNNTMYGSLTMINTSDHSANLTVGGSLTVNGDVTLGNAASIDYFDVITAAVDRLDTNGIYFNGSRIQRVGNDRKNYYYADSSVNDMASGEVVLEKIYNAGIEGTLNELDDNNDAGYDFVNERYFIIEHGADNSDEAYTNIEKEDRVYGRHRGDNDAGDIVHKTKVRQTSTYFDILYNEDNDENYDSDTDTLMRVEKGDMRMLTFSEVIISGRSGDGGTTASGRSVTDYLYLDGQTYYRVERDDDDTAEDSTNPFYYSNLGAANLSGFYSEQIWAYTGSMTDLDDIISDLENNFEIINNRL